MLIFLLIFVEQTVQPGKSATVDHPRQETPGRGEPRRRPHALLAHPAPPAVRIQIKVYSIDQSDPDPKSLSNNFVTYRYQFF